MLSSRSDALQDLKTTWFQRYHLKPVDPRVAEDDFGGCGLVVCANFAASANPQHQAAQGAREFVPAGA